MNEPCELNVTILLHTKYLECEIWGGKKESGQSIGFLYSYTDNVNENHGLFKRLQTKVM